MNLFIPAGCAPAGGIQIQTVVEELSFPSSSGGTCLYVIEVRRFDYLSLATWHSISRLQAAFLHGHCETIPQHVLANFACLPDV